VGTAHHDRGMTPFADNRQDAKGAKNADL